MNSTILNAIKQLSSGKRVELYNALVGKDIKRFASVEAGISQCTGASKAAGDEAVGAAFAKIGVPLDAQAAAVEGEEVVETPKPAKKASSKPAAKAKEKAKPEPKTSRIMDKVKALAGKPKTAAPEQAAKRKSSIGKVKPTFAGTSKLQSASRRAAVLAVINENKKGITLEALNAQMGEDCSGFVQKLLEKNWVEVVE